MVRACVQCLEPTEVLHDHAAQRGNQSVARESISGRTVEAGLVEVGRIETEGPYPCLQCPGARLGVEERVVEVGIGSALRRPAGVEHESHVRPETESCQGSPTD